MLSWSDWVLLGLLLIASMICPKRPEVLAWPRNLSACRCWKRGQSTSWTGPWGGTLISVSCCWRVLQPREGWEGLQGNCLLVGSLHGWPLAALCLGGEGSLRSSGEREDYLWSLIVKRVPSRPWAHLRCHWGSLLQSRVGWGSESSGAPSAAQPEMGGHRAQALCCRVEGDILSWVLCYCPTLDSLSSLSSFHFSVLSLGEEFTVHKEDQELCYPDENSSLLFIL